MLGKKRITVLYNNRHHEMTVDTSNEACTKFGSCLSGNRLYDPKSRQTVIIEGVQFASPWARVSKGRLLLWATAEGQSISTRYTKKTAERLRKLSTPENIRK